VLRYLLTIVLAAAAFASEYTQFSGRVLRVSDGDTLTVDAGGSPVKLRLYGVNSPEKKQEGGPEAAEFTRRLALDQTVTVVGHGTDKYGRLLGDVVLPDQRSLSKELLAHGHAWWYKRFVPTRMDLRDLEASARRFHLGLWAARNPQDPDEWRKQQRNASHSFSDRSEPRSQRRSGRRSERRSLR
jgi:endonuclease YncB( thermonuclease family)